MYPNMWNLEMESIGPEAQRRMEQEKLERQLAYVASESAFYARKYGKAGLSVSAIRHPEELHRLPFTTKAELRTSQETDPPYGDFLAAPREAISRVHRTSGSTGKFLYTALTKKDIQQTNDCGARAFWAGGLRPHHTVVHCLNYCLWAGGYTDHSNLETTGAAVIPFGVKNSRQLVEVMKAAQVNAISGTPSYPNYLEEVVREVLHIEPIELGIRLGLFGGEPALENPEFKRRLEQTWGMRAANANYGMSDVLCNFASVCDHVDSLHFLGQGALLAQLIDPAAEEDVPIEAGRRGELVLTNLDREAQPLVRFRTRDVIDVVDTGPCACGRTGFRFRIVGRSDDMLHVKGINVFPSGVADVLDRMVPDVTGEFQIQLRHPAPYDHLPVLVERGGHVPEERWEALRRDIEGRIQDGLSFRAEVELVAPGSIPRSEMGKTRRVVRTH